MNKIYVIAGTRKEADNWIRNNIMDRVTAGGGASLHDYIPVTDVYQLRGMRDIHGYFVGSFRRRSDLQEIVQTIRIVNNVPQGTRII